jgi:hypothetical protein
MHIIDLNDNEITITDLSIALMQADDYRNYRVQSPTSYQLHLYNYWEDFYQKLLILDAEIKAGKDKE